MILLQPTSPLRTTEDIDRALELYATLDCVGVVSVCECEHNPLWSNTLGEDMCMANFIPESIRGRRSQDLPKYFRINGAIYIYSVEELILRGGIYYDKGVYAYKMGLMESIDIDSEFDFKCAEACIKR